MQFGMATAVTILSCLAAVTTAQFPARATVAADYLLMRRNECPGGTFQCPTSLGPAFSDVCCQNGQQCAVDNNDQPACCPSGAVCTGAAPSDQPTGAPTTAVSYVDNSYFSFPYAPTEFDDGAVCSSAVDACSENYNICIANLGGQGDFLVTIDVPGGGGITVDATAQNLGAEATSICSSLSSEACGHLRATSCEDIDSAGSGSRALLGTYLMAFVSVATWPVVDLFR